MYIYSLHATYCSLFNTSRDKLSSEPGIESELRITGDHMEIYIHCMPPITYEATGGLLSLLLLSEWCIIIEGLGSKVV